MSLYKQIRENFILPNAFSEWKEYRDTLTRYLIKETDNIALPLQFTSNMSPNTLLPTLAIIGAGACNDFDLAKLAEHFSKITLIDCNREALEQAIQTYELTEANHIELKTVSLNGITDFDYESFCEDLQDYVRSNQNTLNMKAFEEFALLKLKTIYKKSRQVAIPLAPASYDYIWCFGVHSQLQAMFSYICHAFFINLNELSSATSDSLHNINNYLKSENDFFIPQFHDALLSSAKKAVFLGLEKNRIGNPEAVEGACQAFADIKGRVLNVTEQNILWPFYPEGNITYDMQILKITL